MLVLPNARTADDELYFIEISRYSGLPLSTGLHPLPLAGREPEPGDPVWLAGAMPPTAR